MNNPQMLQSETKILGYFTEKYLEMKAEMHAFVPDKFPSHIRDIYLLWGVKYNLEGCS